MDVAIQIPDTLSAQLQVEWKDLPRAILEATALEGYRNKLLSSADVRSLLNHASRWETEEFLKRHGADLHYSEADLESDIQTLRQLRNR